MSQATIVLKEKPYFLVDHWSKVPQDIYVSTYTADQFADWCTISHWKFPKQRN